jgi:tetratricopeptide (TPR) repeat protein
MTRQNEGEPLESPEAYDLLRQLKALDPPLTMPAPAHFLTRVQARIATRQTPVRGRWRPFWRPVWAPVLLTSLVLSLTLNVWLGTQASRRESPLPEAFSPTRGGGEEAAAVVARGDRAMARGATALQAEGHATALVLRKLAEAYYRLGQYPQARDTATAALILAPQEARAYWYRGAAQEALGAPGQAIADWQTAARLGDREAQSALQIRGIAW